MTYIEYLNDFNRWLEDDNPTDKAVILYYGMLNTFNRRGWPGWAGVDTQRLLMLVRTSDKKVAFRARDSLVRAGFLRYKPGGKGRITEYQLTGCGGRCLPENAAENAAGSAAGKAAGSGTGNAAPNKTETKTKTENTPPVSPRAEDHGFGPELEAAFSDWLAYKEERRERYRPTGLKALTAEIRSNAAVYGEDEVAKLIRACMASNWRGIIFERLGRQEQARGESGRYIREEGESL